MARSQEISPKVFIIDDDIASGYYSLLVDRQYNIKEKQAIHGKGLLAPFINCNSTLNQSSDSSEK